MLRKSHMLMLFINFMDVRQIFFSDTKRSRFSRVTSVCF